MVLNGIKTKVSAANLVEFQSTICFLGIDRSMNLTRMNIWRTWEDLMDISVIS